MFRDLQGSLEPANHRRACVAIVGAGIAGLLLATRLARSGVHVLVLESGGEKGSASVDHSLNVVELANQSYRGATEGRSRGLGGTSQLWGGAMLPFLPCDMEANTAGWTAEWPVSYRDVASGFPEIERIFNLPADDYCANAVPCSGGDGFIARSAKWPSFQRRNVVNVLKGELKELNVEIWINATVTRFEVAANGCITRVYASNLGGNQLVVNCDMLVISAGAIESTRLLLLLDAQNGDRIFAPDRQLGSTFFDHLSTSAATIVPLSRDRLNRMFGLKFEHGGMRDLRLEPSPAHRRRHRLPAAFAHVAAISEEPGAFDALRAIYQSLQCRGMPSSQQVRNLATDLPWLARAVVWRFAYRRLLYPRDSNLNLVLVTEQHPNPANTISLSRTAVDAFGVPLARIDWCTSDIDVKAFASLQEEVCAFWRSSDLAALGTIRPIAQEIWQSCLQSDADVFHPGGTTRMASSAANGVVDRDLRAFRVPNLTVVSTSCFPTGGGANPTFMLMAFALRAADQIASQLRRKTTPQ